MEAETEPPVASPVPQRPVRPTSAMEWKCLGDEYVVMKKYKCASISYMMAIALDDKMFDLCLFPTVFKHTEVGLVFTDAEVNEWRDENFEIDFTFIANHRVLSRFNSSDLSIPPSTHLYTVLNGKFVSLPRFFRWIIPGHLCASGRPDTFEQIQAVRALGVDVVVSLTAEAPLPSEWFPENAHDSTKKTPLTNDFLPVVDFAVPGSKQVNHFVELVESGPCVLVHCRGGIGRTGVFLSCFIALHGFEPFRSSPVMSGDQAIEVLRRMRPGSVETKAQADFVARFVRIAKLKYHVKKSCNALANLFTCRSSTAKSTLKDNEHI